MQTKQGGSAMSCSIIRQGFPERNRTTHSRISIHGLQFPEKKETAMEYCETTVPTDIEGLLLNIDNHDQIEDTTVAFGELREEAPGIGSRTTNKHTEKPKENTHTC